jgi:SsrA-binding protein
MSKKKKPPAKESGNHTPNIRNKKANFNFQLLEKLEAGIALQGTEVKSLRQGKASLEEAYARIRNGELYLIGCHISEYDHGNIQNHEPTRPRKLLVHRRELVKIEVRLTQKGLTLVPLRIYFKHGLAKVEIALATGKTQADKRDKLKKQQMDRDVSREIRRFQR